MEHSCRRKGVGGQSQKIKCGPLEVGSHLSANSAFVKTKSRTRNAIIAHNYRKKKKQYTETLESDVEKYKLKRSQLQGTIASQEKTFELLKTEISDLKEKIATIPEVANLLKMNCDTRPVNSFAYKLDDPIVESVNPPQDNYLENYIEYNTDIPETKEPTSCDLGIFDPGDFDSLCDYVPQLPFECLPSAIETELEQTEINVGICRSARV